MKPLIKKNYKKIKKNPIFLTNSKSPVIINHKNFSPLEFEYLFEFLACQILAMEVTIKLGQHIWFPIFNNSSYIIFVSVLWDFFSNDQALVVAPGCGFIPSWLAENWSSAAVLLNELSRPPGKLYRLQWLTKNYQLRYLSWNKLKKKS